MGGASNPVCSGRFARYPVWPTEIAGALTASVYLGLTVRLWDSSDPAWGDTRPFAARLDDIEQNELGGKHPAFLTVYLPLSTSTD
jgi:hypothetical protein